MKNLAPIVLFTYKRLYETRLTIEALQKNYLAPNSVLYIFSDGPKNLSENTKVEAVRNYLRNIEGFKSIHIKEAKENKGLAKSVINGVSEVLYIHDRVIVLEDDLVTSPNFLDFMNQALEFYVDSPDIISISGYTMNLPTLKNYTKDYYIGYRACSWGWGTWRKKWQNIDWEVSDYNLFKRDFIGQYKFFNIGSDMPKMLKNQMRGKIDSWAIRWCYHQFRYNLVTIYAAKSKINNIGFTAEATHTKGAVKFNTPLDTGIIRNFKFHENLIENKRIVKEFRAKYSIKNRAFDKLRKFLSN